MASTLPAVRVLPMDSGDEEFAGKSAAQVQRDFFLRDLPSESRGGQYRFKTAGLTANRGTAVLFQFDNQIIASATLTAVERFDDPDGEFHGILHFDVDSIQTFDPVGVEGVRAIWPKFKWFSQIKWSLDTAAYPAFVRGLTNIKAYSGTGVESPLPEEVTAARYVEGAVRTITVNAYERNPEARRQCIAAHQPRCYACGFDFGAVYGPEFAGFIHVHHLRPLSEVGGEYAVDPVEDLRPVCPNCHAVIHHGGRLRSIEEVRQLLAGQRHAEPGAAADPARHIGSGDV